MNAPSANIALNGQSRFGATVERRAVDRPPRGSGRVPKSAGAKGNWRCDTHPRKGTADVYYDVGMNGLRGWAVDYSGAAGAPALLAVVDKVTGSAGDNRWHLVTDRKRAV
jgi:hypothetical protein